MYCDTGNTLADESNNLGFDALTIEGGYSAWKEYGNKKRRIAIMNHIWNKVYKSEITFHPFPVKTNLEFYFNIINI